ncbi:thiamine pyrophosphate-dependent dehydrogenase E1 component subunit alpha [Micropruina sonneratiae]|uniref:thiamine pyrophosphate-dependent dehydrogenase E1 component subunit alpha n=1 Tax=Micropruina sonneratiae TaxID=2986940 RepID=UPI002226F942|nr:thiamine pyrophosphate-dependent dehydrogenase E1 component subunit alpha [Micropruina sp. KQZ13P-5]MCW3159163.1 thiamine pyrophosphate-dependent dehydrogenase E1 component subunit alpha [Micropruina sp. KQZ13P-5]
MSEPAVDDFVQLLTPDGERVQHPEFDFAGSDDEIAGYLREMVLARRFDSEATALQRKGELGLWPPALGQEAAQVGSVNATRLPDHVFPSYREHAVALHLGVDPVEMLGTFRGTAMVPWDTAAMGLHLYSFVIGTQTLHATGYAMGLQRDGLVGNPEPADNGAVIVYFGDGATSQGDVNEAFIFAASYTAPVVFFCQNNQYAISEPIALQSKIPLYRRASGFGFPGVRVDGNDVLAVQAVTASAMQRARRGEGPTLVEAYTYRMGAHTTSDDPTKYRSRDETDAWRARDPISRVQTYLLSAGAIDQAWLDALDAESEELAVRVREGCLALREPKLEEFFEHTVIDPGEVLLEQRDEYLEYEAGFADEGEPVPSETHERVQEAL